MQCGWASTAICHHCRAQRSDYLKLPAAVGTESRRDLDDFLNNCLKDQANRSRLSSCLVGLGFAT